MLGGVWRLKERQMHLDQGTAARILLNRDVPAVDFHRPLRDRQTETRPSAVSRARFIETKEAIEDAVTVFGGDAWALVGDFNDRVLKVGANANVDRRSPWAVFDGVVDEIRDRLAKGETIDVRHRAVSGVDPDSLVALLGKNRE